MTYNTHCSRPNVPFPEELTNARIEAEDRVLKNGKYMED
jgi:hypothetical protein